MAGLRNRDAGVTLVKAYGVVSGHAWRAPVAGILREVATWLDAAPYGFSVNYGNAKKFEIAALDQALGSFDAIEYLDLLSKSQRVGLFITAPFSGKGLPLFECCLFRAANTDQERFFFDVVQLVRRHFRVVYAYGRELPPDSNALSETVRRRTLFGNSVLKSDPQAHVWKSGPTLDGGLKGLYRFNLVASGTLHDIIPRTFIESLPPDRIKPIDSNFSAIVLSGADLEGARAKLPDMRDFVRV